ncbi:MAG TPA: tetratricopeptide repeat protein [Polyangiaceae bacterium]|nr:tetratricopeptide repeat protein [Polyangiaceae bacterium]
MKRSRKQSSRANSTLYFLLAWGSCLAAASGSTPAAAQAAALPPTEDDWRDVHDVAALRLLEHKYPGAKAELERGEALLRAGEMQKAAHLFGELAKRSPEGGLASRRYCQALIHLGRRDEAVVACKEAVGRTPHSPSLRATSAALMMTPPTPMDLNLAVRYAEQAKHRQPEEPWGYAAECDIAEGLGDQAMLKKCTNELARVAPGHYETLRRLNASTPPAMPRWVTGSWLAIALVALGTVAHALLRRARSVRAAGAAAGLALLSLSTTPARADAPAEGEAAAEAEAPMEGAPVEDPGGIPAGGLSRFKVNREDPTRDIPSDQERNRDPIHFGYFLMDLADLAKDATDKGNHAQAAKYWEATAKAVPEAALGYRNACASWAAAGDIARAIGFCRSALGINGVKLLDHEAYAKLVLKKAEPLTPVEIEDISEMIQHLRSDPVGGPAMALQMSCDLGTKLEDPQRLKECTDELVKTAPNDSKTITYLWALAMAKHDVPEAERLVDRAKKSGMKPEGLQKMIDATAKAGSLTLTIKRQGKLLIGIAGCLVILIGGFGLLFRRELAARLQSMRLAKGEATTTEPATGAGTSAI